MDEDVSGELRERGGVIVRMYRWKMDDVEGDRVLSPRTVEMDIEIVEGEKTEKRPVNFIQTCRGRNYYSY